MTKKKSLTPEPVRKICPFLMAQSSAVHASFSDPPPRYAHESWRQVSRSQGKSKHYARSAGVRSSHLRSSSQTTTRPAIGLGGLQPTFYARMGGCECVGDLGSALFRTQISKRFFSIHTQSSVFSSMECSPYSVTMYCTQLMSSSTISSFKRFKVWLERQEDSIIG